ENTCAISKTDFTLIWRFELLLLLGCRRASDLNTIKFNRILQNLFTFETIIFIVMLQIKLTYVSLSNKWLIFLFDVFPEKTCPAGWKMFSCSCYLLSQSSDSWDAGRNKCRERGADLAVIDSAEEQDFLATFTQRPTWIGLTDTQEEGKWKWVDGTPLTLKYWAPHQPDNGGGDPKWGEEDCAQIRTLENTLWNDLSCGSSLSWVCEKVP
uniref:C-type lectin domain-containing protein n=1 Tax=Amphilophus citrinellus TaxID=61819 RepID=A0A3Q0T3Q8_AMPCI